jgi:hypothetical protein
MKNQPNKDDKRSASQKLVDTFFEEHLDTALKPFSDFLLTDFSRVMNDFQQYAIKRQEEDFRILNKLGMLDPGSIDRVGKEMGYNLQEVIDRFIRDLQEARVQIVDMSARTALECFKGANGDSEKTNDAG